MKAATFRALLLGAVAAMLFAWAPPARAQGYIFRVPTFELQATVNPDASVSLDYTIVFHNLPGAHAIDMVDVGLPTKDYDTTNMVASVDGQHVYGSIGPSPRVKDGVVVHLGRHAIPAGATGTFRFHTVVPDLVFNDTTDRKLASFRITPTWFASSVVAGTSDLKIAVLVPKGVKPDQLLHQGTPFTEKAVFHDRAAAIWEYRNARVTGPHLVGLSFPISSMKRVVHISKLELLARWWVASPGVRLIAALLMLGLFAFEFFRFSGRTGCTVWGALTAGAVVLFIFAPRMQLWLVVPWVVALVLMEWALRRKRRDYLPPIVNVEGGGIKRGLTAPEAAALLEVPLGKLVTLVVFGLLKKGVLVSKQTEPLVLEVAEAFRGQSPTARRKAASQAGVVLQKYENAFIDEVEKHAGKPVTEMDFSDAVKGLLDAATSRVSGFDVSDTKAYYKKIVERAWKMAEDLGPIDQRTKAVDKNLEWLLIDHGYQRRFDHWGTSGFLYAPLWIRSPGSAIGPVGTAPSGGSGSSAPSFGDVSGSFAGWTQNVTAGIAGAILPGAVTAPSASGGVINLSGFDHATADVFQAMAASGSSSGGGSGGGCACACAGCACACACAGGGV